MAADDAHGRRPPFSFMAGFRAAGLRMLPSARRAGPHLPRRL